jgi:hypothetical protein
VNCFIKGIFDIWARGVPRSQNPCGAASTARQIAAQYRDAGAGAVQ